MKLRPKLILAVVVLVSPLTVYADSMTTMKVMMTEQLSNAYNSGLKSRTEMTMPVVGQIISITRVDKGVNWNINPKKKTYSEEPIALPYQKGGSDQKSPQGRPMQDPDDKCTAKVTKLSQSQTIGGMKSNGYAVVCKEEPEEKITLWISEPTPAITAALKEQETYSKEYLKQLFSKYPAKEKEGMMEGGSFLGAMLGSLPKMMDGGQIPKGLWTKMETESDGEKDTWFEIVKFSAAPLKQDLFEVPAGYKKVENAHRMDPAEAMKGMEGSDVDFKKMGLDSIMKQFGGKE